MIRDNNPVNPVEAIVQKTAAFVRMSLSGAEGGHDWYHTERVWKMARYILKKEGRGDRLVTELGALMHDLSDPKFNDGDEEEGSRMACNFLVENDVDRETAEHIRAIIRHVSFKGGFPQERIHTIEFQIVQDADRLDAMGAIGIARAFNYGGFRNRPLYDPAIALKEYKDSRSYHQSGAPTINHFYEKLLKLKDLMNTPTGKQLARERHEYMLQFLERFFRECEPGGSKPE